MKCAFCATGKQGFKRNSSVQEIVDQYRLSQSILTPEKARVANIVFMGQGEPLLNYDNVKNAINVLLKNTDLGPTKITVSTAGVVPSMERVLTDPDFPLVRWAISLHSALEESRRHIMPSHQTGFLDFLVRWSNDYHEKFGTKTHFIGLEYIMLGGVNDDDRHLKALIQLAQRMPYIRINLIPYNAISDAEVNNIDVFSRTPSERIEQWRDTLMRSGFTVTIRYSQGQDIAAACGQLRNKTT
jgi:23S rRNA (adenine2503-C2)-methyltransferase